MKSFFVRFLVLRVLQGETNMIKDAELLRRYAKARSQDAFAELVRRHLNLVYSAALRQVGGDSYLAQDVTQTVFNDLARKATSLSRRPVIIGWLYTSTHFAAAKTVRGEQRRRVREQEAQVMHELLTAPATELDWDRLRPVIDDVMHKLNQRDREVILLRYFEGLPLAQVGAQVGLNENAARMCVDRALDKLRGLLAKRGVTSTTSVLTALIAGHAVIIAPSGLAATITGASLASAAAGTGFTILKLMSITKLKVGMVSAIVVAGLLTMLIVQNQSLAKLRQGNAALLEKNRQLDELRAENERLSKIELDADELTRLRREHSELVRLRGEVGRFRRDGAELSRAASNVVANVVTPDSTNRDIQILVEAQLAVGPADVFAKLGIPVRGASSVLTESQFRVVLRSLEQSEGVDLLEAPRITTLSGRQTSISLADPRTTDGASEETGVPVLDFLATAVGDGMTINLTVLGKTGIVWDGQTMVVSKIIGSASSRSASRDHLILFATPTIIDPAGNRLHTDEEIAAKLGTPQ